MPSSQATFGTSQSVLIRVANFNKGGILYSRVPDWMEFVLPSDMEHNSPAYLHRLIEALQLSFADTWWYCADPSKVEVPIDGMLSKEYARERRELTKADRSLPAYLKGEPSQFSETVYFSVVDCHGNACSFINSNFMGFGTGLVPETCGFTLQACC